jgi:hypothetical protein
MPDGTDLHGDEVVELVARVGGGGQAKPAPDRDLFDGERAGGSWHVVALVGDYQPVSGGETRDIVPAGQGLQSDHLDGAAQLHPAAAKLPGLDAAPGGRSYINRISAGQPPQRVVVLLRSVMIFTGSPRLLYMVCAPSWLHLVSKPG